MRITMLILWVERWITKKIREQRMLSVFVVEMSDTKLKITDVQLEGNSAGNLMGQYIWWGSMLNKKKQAKEEGVVGTYKASRRRRSAE